METDSLSRLKNRLDIMRKERDHINSVVLNERAKVSQMEADVQKIRNDYLKQKKILDDKEISLQRYNETIRESDSAYYKLVNNSDKLLSALENEYISIASKFK